MKIWLDDVRMPPNLTWEWASSFAQLRYLLLRADAAPEVISFDHDLGPDTEDGYDIIKIIAQEWPTFYPERVEVHSANPVGADNIEQYDRWFRRMRREDT